MLFGILIMLFLKHANAQVTTQSEYNIIRTWYAENEKYDANVGSIRPGYKFTDAQVFDFSPRPVKIVVRKLIRHQGTLAGTLIKIIVLQRNFPLDETYYCLPAPNSDKNESYGWKLFIADLDQMDKLKADAVRQWLITQLQPTPEKSKDKEDDN